MATSEEKDITFALPNSFSKSSKIEVKKDLVKNSQHEVVKALQDHNQETLLKSKNLNKLVSCLLEREVGMKKDVKLTTSLRSGLISKDSDEIWGVGSVDEANSFIGLAKVKSKGLTREILERVQRKMFNVGAEIISGREMITKRDVEELDRIIKEVGEKIKQPNKFIILEQNEITAYLSVARASVRRAERWAVRLNNSGKVGIHLVEWLNKLSCLLYLLILYELRGKYEVVQIDD